MGAKYGATPLSYILGPPRALAGPVTSPAQHSGTGELSMHAEHQGQYF